jgi:hypothetical protein
MKKYLESIVFKLHNIIWDSTVASLFNIRSKLLHSNAESLCLYQYAQWTVRPKQQNKKKKKERKEKEKKKQKTFWLTHIKYIDPDSVKSE